MGWLKLAQFLLIGFWGMPTLGSNTEYTDYKQLPMFDSRQCRAQKHKENF